MLFHHPRLAPGPVLALSLCFTFFSCSTATYLEQADEDVYGILESAQEFALREQAGDFSINTPYSRIPSADLTSADILKNRSAAGKLEITIDKALTLAMENSRSYQDQKEDLYLTALTLTGEQHRFNPQLSADSTADYTWLPGTRTLPSPIPGNPPITRQVVEERGTVRSKLGISQLLLTGGSIGLNIANDLLRFYTGDSRKSAISSISANLYQPLLRGAGSDVAAERLTQAQRDVIYSVRDFSHFQNTFSSEIVVQYFRLLQQKDNLYNQYANYQSRVDTTAYLRARAVDRAKPLDVSSAEQDELSARNAYIASVVSFKNAEDNFKITLGLPTSTRLVLQDSEMLELRAAGPLPVYLEPSHGFELALANRLPLLNSIDRFEDAQRQIVVAADALKPGLDLFADASIDSGEGPLDYSRFDSRDLTANVGIALDLPTNKTLERNNLRATQIQFEAAARSLGLTFDQLRNSIDQSIRQLAQFRQSYTINQNALDLAVKRVEGARLQLEAGTALFRDLQEAQDALIRAQISVTAALVDYLEVRLGLLAELGILETDGRFWLRADASRVDVSKPPGGALPEAFLTGEELITPDQLFSQ